MIEPYSIIMYFICNVHYNLVQLEMRNYFKYLHAARLIQRFKYTSQYKFQKHNTIYKFSVLNGSPL